MNCVARSESAIDLLVLPQSADASEIIQPTSKLFFFKSQTLSHVHVEVGFNDFIIFEIMLKDSP